MTRALLIAATASFILAACASEGGEVMAGETGGTCAGIAAIPCAESSDYCAMEPGTCKKIADVGGVCKPTPEVCTMEYRPVCGCDANTYSNACAAAAKGVSVDSEGECPAAE